MRDGSEAGGRGVVAGSAGRGVRGWSEAGGWGVVAGTGGVVVVSGGRGLVDPSSWGIGDSTAGRQTVLSSFPAPVFSGPRKRPALVFRREAIEGGVADRSGGWGVGESGGIGGVSEGRGGVDGS